MGSDEKGKVLSFSRKIIVTQVWLATKYYELLLKIQILDRFVLANVLPALIILFIKLNDETIIKLNLT